MKQSIIILVFLLLLSNNSYAQESHPQNIRNEKVSFNFNLGIGFMQPIVVFTKLGYENSIIPQVSLLNDFGIELEYNINKTISLYSGFLLHRKSYKLALGSGSNSTIYGYSYTFPLFIRYNLSENKNSPYISLGSYYNLERDEQFFTSFGTINGVHVINNQILGYNNLSLGIELGKRFTIRNTSFSASIHYNYSWQKSYEGEIIDFAINDVTNQDIGYTESNGSAIGLRLKYHFGLFSNNPSKAQKDLKKGSAVTFYKNYFNLDILGESLFYSISYERFLYRKNWVHFSLKAGLSYIPEYDDGSFSSNIDATKSMGLFIPSSLNLYLGKRISFIRLGQAFIPTYSPYYHPQFHDSNYGWFTYYVSIVGFRFEHKKWAINAHMNFQFSSPVPYGGLTIARAF